MSRRDLVLINPGSRKEVYQSLGGELTAIEPPLWTGMFATFARNRGFDVCIIDAEAEDLTPSEVASAVAREDPRLATVVAFGHQPSASTQTMPAAGRILREIKLAAPDLPTLIVGGHASALPMRTMREEGCDFLCVGEGPQTIKGLLEHFRGAGAGIESIPGLWYRDPVMGIQGNAAAPNLKNLDTDLGGVAWDLLPMEKYRAHNWHVFGRVDERQPYASLYTTLGCPYKCSFCCIQAPFRADGGFEAPNSYRFFSVDHVLGELETLQTSYGVAGRPFNLKIADEMFVLNERHVRGICEGIVERGLNFNIWAYSRVDTVKPYFLEMLKRAGVNWLALGIESASKHVRDGVEKGRFGYKEIVEVVRQIQAADINVIGNFIFGLPDDSRQTMEETLQLALELRCEMANFYSAMAYPGSRLYEQAIAEGWELPGSWAGFSQHAVDSLPLPTEFVSSGEVLGFRDAAFSRYFGDPGYLGHVRARFGVDTETHIRAMAAHALRRQHAIPPRALTLSAP